MAWSRQPSSARAAASLKERKPPRALVERLTLRAMRAVMPQLATLQKWRTIGSPPGPVNSIRPRSMCRRPGAASSRAAPGRSEGMPRLRRKSPPEPHGT